MHNAIWKPTVRKKLDLRRILFILKGQMHHDSPTNNKFLKRNNQVQLSDLSKAHSVK